MTPIDPLSVHRSSRVWDSGLQPERTSLAWQRVNLAGLAASLVCSRLVLETHPLIGYALAVVSGLTAGVLTFVHSRRLRRTNAALMAGGALPDAKVHLLVLFLLVVVALAGLVFALAPTFIGP